MKIASLLFLFATTAHAETRRIVVGRPMISVRVVFHSGSVDDPAGQEGITELTARLLTEGGTEKLSSAELLQTLFPWNAEIEFHSDKELTVFTGRAHKDHWEKFLPIFADVIARPRFDAKEFERLRSAQQNDIENELRMSSDEHLARVALEMTMFRGHVYAHPTEGSVRALKKLTLEAVKAHHRAVFARDRMDIVLAGAVDEKDERTLLSALASLPEKSAARVLPPLPMPKKRILIIEKPEAPATAVSFGFPIAMTRKDERFVPFWLGVSTFGEHRQQQGRLFVALRENRGLNYGTYAYAEHFDQEGWSTFPLPAVPRSQQYFSVWIRPVEHKNRMFALRAAMYELDKLLKAGISGDELKGTVGFLKSYTASWQQTLERKSGHAVDDVFYGTPEFLERFRGKADGVSVDAVNMALRAQLSGRASKPFMAIVTKDAKALWDALVSKKPSPIVYDTPKPKAITDEDKIIEAFSVAVDPSEIEIMPIGAVFE